MRADAVALPAPGGRRDIDGARTPAAQHRLLEAGGEVGQHRALPHRQLCRPEDAVGGQRAHAVHAVVHAGKPSMRSEAVDPVVIRAEGQKLPA
jgi:hypothetical protein